MFLVTNVRAELQKVARGKKTKIGIANLAELVLQTGYSPRKPRKRKPEDVRFLEQLYRLRDERA